MPAECAGQVEWSPFCLTSSNVKQIHEQQYNRRGCNLTIEHRGYKKEENYSAKD